jgi:CRISPR-associated exonuclease Cas4
MEFADDDIIMISAISHHLYCPRQNALIHVEGVFADNERTVSGNLGHEFVDEENELDDHGTHKETSLRVYSDELGIVGTADIVEFPEGGVPFPIDYKNGKIAKWVNHEAQLCAIALCLEEMMDCKIETGAIYHITSKKRHTVHFDEKLRSITLQAITEIRHIFRNNILPEIAEDPKLCVMCSLKELCLPELFKSEKINLFKAVELG